MREKFLMELLPLTLCLLLPLTGCKQSGVGPDSTQNDFSQTPLGSDGQNSSVRAFVFDAMKKLAVLLSIWTLQ